jgi:hypothetical protein
MSGRFVLRLPPGLHEELARRAREQGVSLNTLCLQALRSYLGGAPAQAGEGVPEKEAPGAAARLPAIRNLLGESLLAVVLFGSVARGEPRGGSDVDLLIVVSSDLPLSRRLYQRWDERLAGEGSDPYTPHFVHLPAGVEQAGSIWFETAVDGVVLYDRGGRVSRFLGRVRRAMADGRLVRRRAYGHPYWIRRGGEASHVQ